jgi:hypothetical protein
MQLMNRPHVKPLAVLGVVLFVLLLWSYPLLTTQLAAQWDVKVHLRWADQFYAAVHEGWWLPRWAHASLNGLGDPTFLYYQPLFYYLTSIFAMLGAPLPYWLLLGGVTIYVLSGLVLYRYFLRCYPPYRSALAVMFVLASPPVFFLATQMSAFPWVLSFPFSILFVAESMRDRPRVARLAILIALVCLSHILSAMMTLLCTGLARLIFAFPDRKTIRAHLAWGTGIALGLGLTAFYLYPALTQLSLITPGGWTNGTGYDWRRNFAFPVITFFQYGLKWAGPQWTLAVLTPILAVLTLLPLRGMRLSPMAITARRLAIVALAAAALGSELAYPLYAVFTPLHKLQFPYRFLFLGSLLASVAFVIQLNEGAWSRWSKTVRTVAVLLFMIYFGQLAILEWKLLSGGTRLPDREEVMTGRFGQPEYLPAVARPAWKHYADRGKLEGECRRLEIECREVRHRTHDFSVTITTTKRISVRLPMFAFPAWQATVDSQVHAYAVDEGTGMIQMDLPAGRHLVALRWVPLPAETVGKWISAAAFCLLLGVLLVGRRSYHAARQLDAKVY